MQPEKLLRKPRGRSKRKRVPTSPQQSLMPKLNIIADCLGVDVNGIDSSNSEADPLEVKCWKDKQRSEFDAFGIKKISADYYRMHGKGLRRHLKVDKNYRNKIAKNEFFKLDQLSKFMQCTGPPSHLVMRQTKSSIQFRKFLNACI